MEANFGVGSDKDLVVRSDKWAEIPSGPYHLFISKTGEGIDVTR